MLRWRTVYGLWPVPVLYVQQLAPGVGAEARGPLVRVLYRYGTDDGIHRHELEHVKQWLRAAVIAAALLAPPVLWLGLPAALIGLAFGVHQLLYLLVKPYRLYAEVRAYRAQMRYPASDGVPISLELAAAKLRGKGYGFDLTRAQALERLSP